MKRFRQYFKKNKYLVLFLGVLFIFGIVVGLYLGISHIEILRENVAYYVEHMQEQSYNYLFFHFFVFVLGLILSFFGIGVPFLCTLIFYEGMCVGFLTGIFSLCFGFSGFLFSFFFLLVTKFFYLGCLFFFFSKCLWIARKMIGKYLYKTDPSLIIVHLLKGSFFLIFLVSIYDIFLWILGNRILLLFQFLLI